MFALMMIVFIYFSSSEEALSLTDIKGSLHTHEAEAPPPTQELYIDTSSSNEINGSSSSSNLNVPSSTKSGASTPGSSSSKKSQRLHDALKFSGEQEGGQIIYRAQSSKILLGGSPKATGAGAERTTTL